MQGFCSASSCSFLGCLLLVPVMVFPVSHLAVSADVVSSPRPCQHHRTFSVRALQTAQAEHGVSFSRHSLSIPFLPEQFGAFLPVPLILWLTFPPLPCQDQQSWLAPGGVSPHLSCYFRFLLLDSCAALNVSGMLSQGDSTTRRLGEVERFDFLCQKNVISHTLGCLTFLFAASKSQEPY